MFYQQLVNKITSESQFFPRLLYILFGLNKYLTMSNLVLFFVPLSSFDNFGCMYKLKWQSRGVIKWFFRWNMPVRRGLICLPQIEIGVVHKLCRLKIGDFWPPPPPVVFFIKQGLNIYLVNNLWGNPPPLSRRNSLWTAPRVILFENLGKTAVLPKITPLVKLF